MNRIVAPLVAAGGGTVIALAATATPAHAAGLPGAGIVTDAIGGMAGWGFEKMAAGFAGWVLEGVAYFANGVLNFRCLDTGGHAAASEWCIATW